MNTTVVRNLAVDLGWDNLNTAEVEDWLKASGIDPAGVVAFMRAVLANPDGVQDTTIAGVVSAQLPYIEEWFRGKGLIF